MNNIKDKFKIEDILNILNLVIFLLCLFCEKKLILISAVLFLITCIAFIVKKRNKQTISFFRYMWSFICTSMGYASGVNVLSNIKKLWILYIIISIIFVYVVTRNEHKNLFVKFLYVLCFSTILHSMVIGINYYFCRGDETHISATVVHKQKNGDWFDTNTFSQIDVYSSDKVYDECFGYQAIGTVGDFYDCYDIGDEITVYINNGIFNITYYYLKDD